MRPMTFPENPLERRALAVAVVVSLAIHGLILFVNNQKPKQGSPLPRIEASLARKPVPVETPVPRLPGATAGDGDSATVTVNRSKYAKMDGRREGGNE